MLTLPICLMQREVHIWRATLDVGVDQEAALFGLLNAEEQARAERFRFAQHRRYFTVARAYLRQLLSLYLPPFPNEIEILYDLNGKPFVNSEKGLEFNVSHSQDKAVYAFTLQHKIGVDIEKEESHCNFEVAKKYFSASEYQALMALPEPSRVEGFYCIWSRKEALIKALGVGLTYSLNSFSVPLDNPMKLENFVFDGALDWHLESFVSFMGYQAAFATHQRVDCLNIRDFAGLDLVKR